jgi:hypothetical protein
MYTLKRVGPSTLCWGTPARWKKDFQALQKMIDFEYNRELHVQLNPVITTSVYTTPPLLRQIFCGAN